MNFYNLFKSAAFKFDAERAHEYTIKALESFPRISSKFFPTIYENNNIYKVQSGKLSWNFPVGIAAGLDKNAQIIDYFDRLKIGCLEVGTVTVKEQIGNPRPRMWRYPQESSLRNAMGFPNEGSQKILPRVQRANVNNLCLGTNIGKNKDTSIEDTPAEYAKLFKMFAPHSDFITVNISSPNTPGLREFQQAHHLRDILNEIKAIGDSTPVLVKIAPDLDSEQIEEVTKICLQNKADGIIATNTTRIESMGAGGVSGSLLFEKAQDVRSQLLSLTRGEQGFSFIGVGGFSNFEQVKQYWKQGGKLAQIYTSFVYQGPQFFYDVKTGTDLLLKKYSCSKLQELLDNPEILKEI